MKGIVIEKPRQTGRHYDWAAFPPTESKVTGAVFGSLREAVRYARANPVFWENIFTGEKLRLCWSILWFDRGTRTDKMTKRTIEDRRK